MARLRLRTVIDLHSQVEQRPASASRCGRSRLMETELPPPGNLDDEILAVFGVT